jgi:hypothetical protein
MGVDSDKRALVFERSPDPRAYVVGAAAQVREWHQAVDRIAAGHDGHRVALVEAPLTPPLPAAPPPTFTASARIRSFRPETVTVEVDTSAAGLLVLAEPFFPGWNATVNGRETACVPVNGWMRGVPVPAGPSAVVFRFHCTRLVSGALLSRAAVSALLAAIVLSRRRAPPPSVRSAGSA